MGMGRWSDNDWKSYARSTSSKSREEIFTKKAMDDELDPSKIKYRESRDSEINPESTPIVLACDVTGSMGHLAEAIVKSELGKIMKDIYDKKPVSDPHICCMAIGDSYCDQAPLQVTQFEAEVAPLTAQVEKLFLEGGGGGNNGESYGLVWAFVADKTRVDAVKKGRRGYIFTIGDENCLPELPKEHSQKLGIAQQETLDSKRLYERLSKDWEIFHLIVQTSATEAQGAIANWKKMLGERAIVMKDYHQLGDVIVGILQLVNGAPLSDVREPIRGVVASVKALPAPAGALVKS
jgi:hypothetical protein